jgi:glutamate synthase domain-containing protein 3
LSAAAEATGAEVVDLAVTPLRELNQRLHDVARNGGPAHWRIVNPNGAHAVAAGLDAEIEVEVEGHVGYYCAGMNKLATVRVHGNASTGLAENIMSGRVLVHGNASQSAAATGRGGLVVVHGDASARCGISMKGVDIVVRGSVGHLSAFMAQTRSATPSTRPARTCAARWEAWAPTAFRRSSATSTCRRCAPCSRARASTT